MPNRTLLFVITQGGPYGGAQRYVHDLAIYAAQEFSVIIAIGEPDGNKDLQKQLIRQKRFGKYLLPGLLVALRHF